MSVRLLAVPEVLDPVLAGLRAVAPVSLVPFEAVGLVLAQDIVAPSDLPQQAIALRRGLAVASLDIAGASAHAPVTLMAPLVAVKAGDPLPEGCDAVLDPDMVTAGGSFGEITESVQPGSHVRLAGHDLVAGEMIAPAGAVVTPQIALVAALAGLDTLAVRRIDVALTWPDSAARSWLSARLAALGGRLVGETDPAALRITLARDGPPRLALKPAETAEVVRDGAGVAVALPSRFDGVVGGWCALALPLIARLSGTSITAAHPRLTRKLVSSLGVSEVALLSLDDDAATPLATGDLPLAAIARANAFSVLPPGLEGYAAGSPVPCVRLDRPFHPLPNP